MRKGDRFKVRSLMKDVFLQEIKTGKKVHVRFRDIDQIKLEQK